MSKPSFLWLGASDYALRILREVIARFGTRLVGLVDAGAAARRYEIAGAVGGELRAEDIHDTTVLSDPEFLTRLAELRPSVAISAHFCELLSKDFLAIPVHGTVNVHSAYLPYNRGHWPEVWSIVRGTPAGMTLHYIDKGIDTGEVIAQERVPVAPEDTCATLAAKLEVVGMSLMLENWEAIVHGRVRAVPQTEKLPINLRSHLETLSEIELDRTYTGRELVDRLRALTIPRLLKGAYFVDPETGDRIHMQVTMLREQAHHANDGEES